MQLRRGNSTQSRSQTNRNAPRRSGLHSAHQENDLVTVNSARLYPRPVPPLDNRPRFVLLTKSQPAFLAPGSPEKKWPNDGRGDRGPRTTFVANLFAQRVYP